MSKYKNILVAIDVCGEYQPIIEKAMQIAGDESAISLIHIVEPFYYPENYMGGLDIDFQEKSVEFAKSEIDEVGNKYNIPEDNRHVLVGKPANTLHAFTQDQKNDLIVMGSHGKHGLQLMLGSTSTSVLHGSICDVLAVRVYD